MKYVSSLIHIKLTTGESASIDVGAISSTVGRMGEHTDVFLIGNPTPMNVKMTQTKFIDLVEDKRRALWEAANATNVSTMNFMEMAMAHASASNREGYDPDPEKTAEKARENHFGNIHLG